MYIMRRQTRHRVVGASHRNFSGLLCDGIAELYYQQGLQVAIDPFFDVNDMVIRVISALL
jgi:hypothetical protein